MHEGTASTGGTIRVIDNAARLDPFIAVDDFSVSYPAVFIDHPHRGFESATYILPEQDHPDSVLLYYDSTKGEEGFHLGPGGLVRMITGKGISHCEVVKEKGHMMRAINLWLNYPKEQRLCEPRSRFYDMRTENMPVVAKDGVRAIVLHGEFEGEYFPMPASQSFPARMGGMTSKEAKCLEKQGFFFQAVEASFILYPTKWCQMELPLLAVESKCLCLRT